MDTKRGYPYIDYFRVIAAILVITIHMHPLRHINPILDRFITDVLARLAVPFFLTATGFFFFKGRTSLSRLYRTVISILQIYGVAILCYLPLNLYQGYFKDHSLLWIVQRFCFYGNAYHLWYLPATIIGICICYVIVTRLSVRWGIVICILLYAIGLGGDSYYPYFAHLPFICKLYKLIFICFKSTRNGVFLAPVFIYIGYLITRVNRQIKYNKTTFGVSLFLLTIESVYIHLRPVLKDDNMYIFLPVTIYLFVTWVLQFRGSRNEMMKQTSVYMYILHPLFIYLLHIGIGSRKHSWYFQDWLQFIWIILILLIISYGLYYFRHDSTDKEAVMRDNH